MVEIWHFSIFWSSTVTKRFDFFNFSTVLKRFCPLDSKTVFVLVLAHLKPVLELLKFMTLAMMVMMICNTIISQTSNHIECLWRGEGGVAKR